MDLMEKITSLAKRRGFIYPGSEIYGGLQGFWDYGPLGVELKNNIKKLWWKDIVYDRSDVVGLDSAIIMNPEVWKASGHLDSFTNVLVDCKDCKTRARADHLIEDSTNLKNVEGKSLEVLDVIIKDNNIKCPNCGKENWSKARKFNQLTEVLLGVTEPKQVAYLRGEITQGVFVNFRNVVDSTRIKIPFGIGQIGKAFRNEVTPGNLTFRSREFEQMELEYFLKPDEKESEETFEFLKNERMNWYIKYGINKENLRFRDHAPDERAHYARFATDIEYNSPFGWKEFEGIHHRGDYDLKNHKLSYKDDNGDEYIPWVIETSGGVDRATLFFLLDAYVEEGERAILKLHPKLSPYKVAVFPLLANKEELVEKAREIYQTLSGNLCVAWDDRGNIGKRYFAQDEIGTPWCITVDFQTLEDGMVTIRDRDTTKQERVGIDNLEKWFDSKLRSI